MSSFTRNATIVLVHGACADGSCWQNVILPFAEQRPSGNVCADSPDIARRGHSRARTRAGKNKWAIGPGWACLWRRCNRWSKR